MPKVKKTITVYKELTENDQVFEVDDFNVCMYFDTHHDDGKEYYLLQLQQFDGNDILQSNSLYILKESEDTCGQVWEKLHNRDVLCSLVRQKKYARIKGGSI